jgi:hypothetical protein
MTESSAETHKSELQRLLAFLALAVLAGGLTYVLPGASGLQPWQSGEPLPLVHLLRPGSHVSVDSYGELAIQSDPSAAVEEPESANDDIQRGSQQPGTSGMASLQGADFGLEAPPSRPPATATPLDLVPGSMDSFFAALAGLDAGERDELVRVMHWGDSTIAADGITGQVRRRLQARFGDGGPGFLAIEVDPRWGMRPGIVRSHEGEWSTQTITFAGAAEDRYGLAGTVSTAEEAASVLMGGLRIDGQRQLLHRFDVHYQSRPGAGSFELRPGVGSRTEHSTASEAVVDRYVTHTSASGTRTLRVATLGDGPVTLYGVALETKGPGITWECLGVAGSSIASLLGRQQRRHLAGQVSRRKPSLLVYQTGGNELTYPLLLEGQGEGYQKAYGRALRMLRAGSPEASCIVIGPLDQAMRKRGRVVSKPGLDRMIVVQRRAAAAEGCSFWDSRHAMGGKGGFGRWLQHKPAYAWTDLMHLSLPGLDLVGDTFTDALLHAYERWRFQQGLGPSPQPQDDAADESPSAEAPASEAGGTQQAGPGVDPTRARPAPPQSDPPATGIRAD